MTASLAVTLIPAAPFSFAVLNLASGKNALTKALADARILQRLLDALDFHHIHADADDHKRSLPIVVRGVNKAGPAATLASISTRNHREVTLPTEGMLLFLISPNH
jgi:hypothetical protein